jgi:lipopolysaccharide exporter
MSPRRSDRRGGGLSHSAVHGGIWSMLQVIANKAFALLGTLALMYLLDPVDYAVAGYALSIQVFLTVLAPFTLGDVLISRPLQGERLMGTAFRLCLAVSVITSVLILAAGPLAAAEYGQPALVAACATAALRPAVELLLFPPIVRMRLRLKFRELALIDGGTQAMATLAAVCMAWWGAGWASLIVPQIAFTAVRAWLCRSAAPPEKGHPGWHTEESRSLMRDYGLAGIGQYVHGSLLLAPPLVIGAFASVQEVGLFSMAFTLTTAINAILAFSMGQVLQPIFAQMVEDPARQRAAFLRACSTIAAVAMPLCLLQAALVGPAIRLMLPDRWDGAVTMAVLLSMGQAFYFAVNPAMSLLKAQGRFKTYLAWQSVQLVVVLGAMISAGSVADADAATAIAAVAGLYTVVWAPIGVWLCLRGEPRSVVQSVALFVRPLVATGIALGPAFLLLRATVPAGTASDLWHLLALPVLMPVLYALALWMVDAPALRECRQIVWLIRARVR